MATVDDLIKRYETDPEFRKEVDEIRAGGKVTISDFKKFAKKHDVNISITELPKYYKKAKEMGFIK